MPQTEFTRKSETLQILWEELATQIGKAKGFVKRESKMTATKFVMTLVLGWLDNPEAPLNELVQVSEDLNVEITESGLHQRMTMEGVELLQELLNMSLKLMRNQEKLPGAVLEQFENIYLIDSSIVTLPKSMQEAFAGFASQGSEAAIKFQLCFEYLRGNLSALEKSEGRQSDQSCTLIQRMIIENCLFLYDLGYFDQDTFAEIEENGAFFVSRHKNGINLYQDKDDKAPIDLLTVLQQNDTRFEKIYYLGSRQRVKVRLIAERLPEHLVAQRRRKARGAAKKKGHTPSKSHLALLAWSIYITNTSPEQLSFDQIMAFYRVRWQIELIFKVWKSQAKLARVGNYRPERTLCQLYARLLGLVTFHWLTAPCRVIAHKELSMTKSFNVLSRHIIRLLDSITHGWHTTPIVLERIATAFRKHAQKDSRRKKPSTYCLLIGSEGLA